MTAPDAHGEAALMLCESLIHLLVEQGLVGGEKVAEAIEGVITIKREMAGRSETNAASRAAIGLLTTIDLSLRAG